MKKVLTMGVFCAFLLSVVGCQQDMDRRNKRHMRRGRSALAQVEQVVYAAQIVVE